MITINKTLYLFTLTLQLLDKDAKTRLGGTECMHGDVREQEFFHPVHWDKLERRELETPFKPRVVILFILYITVLWQLWLDVTLERVFCVTHGETVQHNSWVGFNYKKQFNYRGPD